MKAPAISEARLHEQVFAYLSWALAFGALAFHVPMGGSRDAREARNLKKLGSRAGIPDLVIISKGRAYFIELKAETGRLSASQKSMFPLIEFAGCPVGVCRSLEEVIAFLNTHMVPLRAESISTERIRRGVLGAMAEAGK